MTIQATQPNPLLGRQESAPGEGQVPQAPLRSRVPRLLRSPLRLRIYGLVVTAAALAILGVWVAGRGDADAARDLATTHYQTVTSAGAGNLAARIGAVQSSLAMADVSMQPSSDLSGICAILARSPQHSYQRVYAFLPDGSLRCASVPGTVGDPDAMRGQSYFVGALNTGQDQVGGPIAGPFTGRLSMAFAHPVFVSSSLVGVLVGGVDVADLVRPDLLEERTARLVLIGRNGERFEAGGGDAPDIPAQVVAAADRVRSTGARCPVIVVSDLAWSCSAVGGTGLVLASAHHAAQVYAVSSGGALYQRYRAISVIAVAVLAAAALDFLFVRRMRLAFSASGLPALQPFDLINQDEVDVLREWAGSTSDTIARLRTTLNGHAEARTTSERELLTLFAEAVEVRYAFLRGHSDRVERYTRQVGIRLGIHGEDLELLTFAARVHDLGRIGIPDAIHLKVGALEPIEMAQVQLHCGRGAEMARRMRTVPAEVTRAIQHHHERWDGGGYPDGLAGDHIPLWSRLIAVADAYDAMTQERPYRSALGHSEASRILLDGAGRQWDAAVVHAFIEVVEG